jgi:hypothetical protein
MTNTKTVIDTIEALKRMTAPEFAEFCLKATEDNLADRLVFALNVEIQDQSPVRSGNR